MKIFEDRVRKDGCVLSKDILKVDTFLNHQIDPMLMREVGKFVYDIYKEEKITKILTIEASGIGMACVVALEFEVPVVFAKKSKSSNLAGGLYISRAHSFTHGETNNILVSDKLISKDDRILVMDDFLANGAAVEALLDIVNQAGASVAGVVVGVEKHFQGGGDKIRARGIRVDAMAKVKSMSDDGSIEFMD